METYLVIPYGYGWALKELGGVFPLKEARTKDEIIAYMEGYMSNRSGLVRIYNEDQSLLEERKFQL